MKLSMTELISIEKGDIVSDWGVDAIVNSAPKTLLGGGGIDTRIFKAAGLGMNQECLLYTGCEEGDCRITNGYKLPCKKVFHTVPELYKGSKSIKVLESCYKSVMALARRMEVRSIAFPALGTGSYHYPKEPAAKTAITTVMQCIKENPDYFTKIVFVCYDDETKEIYDKLAKKIIR